MTEEDKYKQIEFGELIKDRSLQFEKILSDEITRQISDYGIAHPGLIEIFRETENFNNYYIKHVFEKNEQVTDNDPEHYQPDD